MTTAALLALFGSFGCPATAVTCAQDTVPAATLLVPYFRVSRNGADGGEPIPAQGANTLLAITNTAPIGVITRFTVFSKYGSPVLGFNVPLRGHDVVFFDMRQILNGELNLNTVRMGEACAKGIGYGRELYQRFENPDPADRAVGSASYGSLPAALLAELRDSLDESGDVTSFLTAKAANILDLDSPGCGTGGDGHLAGDFSGYMTIDVVNYCTTHGPAYLGSLYFVNDAIATNGWAWSVNGDAGETPNVLLGDVFSVDPAASGGDISGDPMVSVEFDARLATAACSWANDGGASRHGCRTFYSRYFSTPTASNDPGATPPPVPEAYRGIGDGREPLASRYGFRYLNDVPNGLKTTAIVWRSDLWSSISIAPGLKPSLCQWWSDCFSGDVNECRGWGAWDATHRTSIRLYDNDGAILTVPSSGGCGICETMPTPYVFLESQRIALGSNDDIGLTDPSFKGGWIDITLGGFPATGQAWVGVQHSAPGQFVSVGHEATVLSKPIQCVPALFAAPATDVP